MLLKWFVSLAVLLMAFVCNSVAQEPVPADDADFAEIATNMSSIAEMANQCSLTAGPNMDCGTVQAYFLKVRDARLYLMHLDYWLKYGSKASQNSFFNGMEDEISERYKSILNVQSVVVDGENYVAVVDELNKRIGELKECYAELPLHSMSKFQDCVLHLLVPLNKLKEAEDAFYGDDAVSEVITSVENGMTQDEFKDLITELTAKKDLAHREHVSGRKWRKPLLDEEKNENVDSGLKRLLEIYTPELAKTRQAQIDQLIADESGLSDEQKAQYEKVRRINERSSRVGTLMKRMEFLVRFNSKTGSGRLTRCYLKLNELCGALDLNYVSRLKLADNIAVKDFKVPDEIDAEDEAWKEPLTVLNAKIPEIAGMLAGVPAFSEREVVASLTPESTSVKTNERLKVKFTSMYHFHPKSWVGFVPSDVPHGYEGNNVAKVKGKRYTLRRMESGEFEIKAPKKPGKYDLRMNDVASGREVASVSIDVVEE